MGIKYYGKGKIVPVVDCWNDSRVEDYVLEDQKGKDVLFDILDRIGKYEKVKITVERIDE